MPPRKKHPGPADELAQLQNFVWPVSKDGHRWVKTKRFLPGRKRVLSESTEMFLVASSMEQRVPKTALDVASFKEFSETPRSHGGVLTFANHHGLLGKPEPIAAVSDKSKGATKKIPIKLGESFRGWMAEIAEMDRLVRAWDSIRRRQPGEVVELKIKQTIRCIGKDQIIYEWVTEHDEGKEVVASHELRPWLLERLLPLKALEPVVRWYLQIAVNQKLVEHRVAGQLLWDRKSCELGLAMAPVNLAGFLWLQFAKAIEGNPAYRRCKDCGRWFELGGRWGRSDKRFCSGTCRTRTYRSQPAAK